MDCSSVFRQQALNAQTQSATLEARSFTPEGAPVLTRIQGRASGRFQASRKVEAIEVHHLVPGRDEVVDELLPGVGAAVNFGQGP